MEYWKKVTELERPEPTLWQKLSPAWRAVMIVVFMIMASLKLVLG